MKARVKATNKIVDVDLMKGAYKSMYISEEGCYDASELDFNVPQPDNLLITPGTQKDNEPCDAWEERRTKIAALLMQTASIQGYESFNGGSKTFNGGFNYIFRNPQSAAEMAVSYADALIKELKNSNQ